MPELSVAFSVMPVVLGMSAGLLGVSLGQQVDVGVLSGLTLALVVLPAGLVVMPGPPLALVVQLVVLGVLAGLLGVSAGLLGATLG